MLKYISERQARVKLNRKQEKYASACYSGLSQYFYMGMRLI